MKAIFPLQWKWIWFIFKTHKAKTGKEEETPDVEVKVGWKPPSSTEHQFLRDTTGQQASQIKMYITEHWLIL